MNNDLINKTIKVTSKQVEWVLAQSGNFSRYIRTLIDREMGAEEARKLFSSSNTQQRPPQKTAVWNFPK